MALNMYIFKLNSLGRYLIGVKFMLYMHEALSWCPTLYYSWNYSNLIIAAGL